MLLEDLIITDTSKENMFELQENYPCCSRDMVITAGNSRVVPWHWHEELEDSLCPRRGNRLLDSRKLHPSQEIGWYFY